MNTRCLYLILLILPLLGFATPPPATEVFQLSAKQVDPNSFSIDWQIKKGFFLYKERFQLTENPGANFHLGSIPFPEALQQTDAQGKKYFVYRNHLTLPVAVLGEQAGEALLTVHFQGCSDEGFCYPPMSKQIKLTIDNTLALNNVSVEESERAPNTPKATQTDNEKLDHLFSTRSWPFIILSFAGFGLLLSFTPCVLPMVPVLSGIIVGHGKNLSTSKAFFLSLSYVLSMSFTYAIVGAIVALMGNNLQIAMQSPWMISLFSLIFVLLALSMFNFYELRLPVSWQAKLASVTRSHSGGHYLGSALMGCLSTLILSPCVTAPLIGALGYIAQSGNVVFGSLSLFALGLGMGTPLLLIGTSAGKLLPKAGHWMNTVKSFFGVMLLAVAIYLMERILPAVLIMGMWACLLVFSGIYMGALTKANSHQEKFSQGLGIILLGYGLLILIGTSQGHSNPLQPLVPTNQSSCVTSEKPVAVVKTVDEVKQALAHANGKPVLLDFYADWCAACKVVANTTLKDERVLMALNDFIVLKVDLTANNAETKALLALYNVVAPPTFLFFDAAGTELDALRLVGEASANTFYTHLNQTLRAVN
jgi:thiol:disulfide interchange protein DsbD